MTSKSSVDDYIDIMDKLNNKLNMLDVKEPTEKQLKEPTEKQLKEPTEKQLKEPINLMDIIEEDDRKLLENTRIINMSRIDWGKTMAVSNQYIQRNILRSMLEPYGYFIYTTDDKEISNIDTSNNSPGFDIIIITPKNKHIRVQSKIRQVKGIHDYSQQTHFETTRRNSKKNIDKNHTGHICYSLDEFDLVMISLVNDKVNREKTIKNTNLWSYSLIPVKDIEDTQHNCCYSHIKPEILKKNIINISDDIRNKL